jgi:hypothetical protein
VSLDLEGIVDAVASHAAASGYFDAVNLHEPKSAPRTGVTAAVWVQDLRPASSGLAATSARLEITVRVYASMVTDPPDMIDPSVLNAVSALMEAYSGDFTLGGLVRSVDLLGAEGNALSARAGYLEQDRRLFRVVDITVPCVINDVFDQAP